MHARPRRPPRCERCVDGGRSIAITLFETEDDLRQGDAALNAMSPGDDAVGRRAAVEVYEVGAEFRV